MAPRRDRARLGRLETLVEAGDHRTARAEGRALACSAEASDAERTAAAAVLASLAPERAALLAGVAGLAIAAAVLASLVRAG